MKGMRTSRGLPGCTLLRLAAALLGLSTVAEWAARAEGDAVRFDTQVRPIFEARCVKCHGESMRKGGLDLRRAGSILEGGDGGPAVVSGKPDESLLVEKVESGEMPPAKEGKLEASQKDVIRRWVQGGVSAEPATAAAGAAASPEAPEPASRISEEDRRFWAYQPPSRSVPPTVANAARVRTPVDAFLLQKLEAKGLSFRPDAPRDVLLRRLCLDLLGLPPTLEQREEFLRDDRPDAVERLVDRLLASPSYGERWGRHWLDVAGYADSDGYLAADRPRPEAWRYRDYVIQAFNEDMPFDRFLTEQLAADEMDDWSSAETLDPDVARRLTATGFLRTASDPTYPGYTEPNEIHQVLSDTMQIVGSTFLGLTLQCARCHAHKFDPISQRDYYSLQAVFLPALDPARWQPSGDRGIPLATEKELARLRAYNQGVDQRLKAIEAELAALTESRRRKRIDELLAGQPAELMAKLSMALGQEPQKRSAEQASLVARLGPDAGLTEADLAARDPNFKKRVEDLKTRIAAESATKRPEPVLVRGLRNLPGKPPQGRVMRRGDYAQPGAPVGPGVPKILATSGSGLPLAHEASAAGRRLALARWLTRPDHPLTTRVQVNRIWARHFGRGLVSTTANFGRSGARPTHPELLDWLAAEFVHSGWSTKAMHRLMVLSTAYRQSSELDPLARSVDPENLLLGTWRPRRIEGEVLRDSILAVSGKLTSQKYGPPAPVSARDDGSVETADDTQGNRRSVYLIVRRSQHLTILDLFDTPTMEINCPERTVSTVPLQALALLHSPFTARNASALAVRILEHAPAGEAGRIEYAYRLLFGRDPMPREVARVRDFLADVTDVGLLRGKGFETARQAAADRAAWTQAALVLLNSNEFVYVQ